MLSIHQTTIASPVTFKGISLHKGIFSTLHIEPSAANTGIIFVSEKQQIPAHWNHIVETRFATQLGVGNHQISTVEHLLSAFAGLGITNAVCYVEGSELPGMDGSAWPFYFGLKSAGVVHQEAERAIAVVTKKIEVKHQDSYATLSPAYDARYSVTLDYTHPLIPTSAQRLSFSLLYDHYPSEIAKARTYGFLKDKLLYEQLGLAQGASVDNAIIFGEKDIENPLGLRYTDEVIRHKILDAIGDLYLIGGLIFGHYEAYKPGHTLHKLLIEEVIKKEAISWQNLSQLIGHLETQGQFAN